MKKSLFFGISLGLVIALGGCWLVGPTGTVEGFVIDSTTGDGLSDVSVSAERVPLASAVTGSDGSFELTLPSGDQVLQFTRDGYQFSPVTVSVVAGDITSLSAGEIMASPSFSEAGIRFVLTWGELPYDLDSHLITPNGEHIYYGNRAPSGAGAYLDVDDTSSYGPETTTIADQQTGTYGYYVHNYSGSPELTVSGATVRIYDQDGFVRSVSVPESGTGDYWRVATVTGSTLNVENTIVSSPPMY